MRRFIPRFAAPIVEHHERLGACVRAMCKKMGVPFDHWTDVVQSYYVHVLVKVIPKYALSECWAVAYSRLTIRRFVIDYLRKHRPGNLLPIDDVGAAGTPPDAIGRAAELALLVDTLPEPYRSTVIMSLETASSEVAAKALKITVTAYRKRMSRAEGMLIRLAQGEKPESAKSKEPPDSKVR